jgi:aminopeptidase
MELDYYTIAKDFQLEQLYPWWKEEYSHVRGSISVLAPTSLTHLKDIDPKRQQMAARTMKPWREFVTKQEQKDLFAWTLGIWPTQCKADKAGISLKEFTDQVVKACYLNSKDVVASWERTHNNIEHIKTWLNELTPNVDYFHMQSASMDLKITPGEQRQWQGGGGANIPSFEIFLSPDWRGTSGTFFSDQQSFRGGHTVKNVRLEFTDGIVTDASASEGEEFLISTLDTDEDARKVGEFSLTDVRNSKIDRFMADTLFDENYGGTYGNSHIAVGKSYSESYTGDLSELTDELKKELGFSESVVHWDLINTETKIVTAVMKDGSSIVIYEDGSFIN